MRFYSNDVDFGVLIGREIKEVVGLERGNREVQFIMSDGAKYRMLHYKECCEDVAIEEIIGDADDLNGAVVIDARSEAGTQDPEGYEPSEWRDSYTWTFYIIQTNKGAVTIRWLGESNGYYGEEVDFEEVSNPH